MPYAQKGERRGGRKKGTKNKLTLARERLAELTAAGGIDSYEHFYLILNDPNAPVKRRDYAAAQLMPYTRPRLAPVVNAPTSDALDTATQVRAALRAMEEMTAPPAPKEKKKKDEPAPQPESAAQAAPPSAKKSNGNGSDPQPLASPTSRGLPIKPRRAAAG